MSDMYEREEAHLYRQYEDGLISNAELNRQLRLLHREEREDALAAAQEAAEQAYRDTMDRW